MEIKEFLCISDSLWVEFTVSGNADIIYYT